MEPSTERARADVSAASPAGPLWPFSAEHQRTALRKAKPRQYLLDKTWRPHNPLPLIRGHQATLVQVPPVRETSFKSKLALNFLLTDGASIGAGRWSGTIPICCRSQHSHDTAFRVGSCTLWPLGNSMYRRTNGPRLSSTYFEPIGNRIGRRAELRMFSRPSS